MESIIYSTNTDPNGSVAGQHCLGSFESQDLIGGSIRAAIYPSNHLTNSCLMKWIKRQQPVDCSDIDAQTRPKFRDETTAWMGEMGIGEQEAKGYLGSQANGNADIDFDDDIAKGWANSIDPS
ncbi:hypothetical protein HAX54_001110 [Datura stramonium]|uniref:Uncharacterized protein n=1 Tax=Datura stramonium TaxID=4076 RepID=A0ABS8RTW3_DATST|nr:hypothetical protein [Datura stramonium]